MSSSSSTFVPAHPAGQEATPDFRAGKWTRLVAGAGVGDPVTENLLNELAEQARARAQAEGYAVGWAQGRREAAAEAERTAAQVADEAAAAAAAAQAEQASRITALTAALNQLQAAFDQLCDQVAEQATTLAWELTQTLVGHQLQLDSSTGVIARAMALVPEGAYTSLRLHPTDMPTDADQLAEFDQHGIQLIPDTSLARGDALLENDTAAVDLRISTAMQRVQQVLT